MPRSKKPDANAAEPTTLDSGPSPDQAWGLGGPGAPAAWQATSSAGAAFDLPDTIVPADTRTKLLQAAMAEFIEAGFAGTDTNRIARRAGFAPQTFYRWFSDKTAIFNEVLQVWEEVEAAMLRSVIESPDVDAMQMAEACVESIRPFLTFRRNLRAVMANTPEIRAVRSESRKRLLAGLAALHPGTDAEMLGSTIVQFEQLCDAVAQGEFVDLGLSGAAAMADLAAMVEKLRLNPSAQ